MEINYNKLFTTYQQTDPPPIITKEYPEEYGEPYYPINDNRNNKLYQKYKNLSESDQSVSIIFAGRLGKYQYFDMDDAILKAFELIESIDQKGKHIWKYYIKYLKPSTGLQSFLLHLVSYGNYYLLSLGGLNLRNLKKQKQKEDLQ